MTVPATIDTYFDLMHGNTPDRAVDTFTHDAVVTDDGTTYRGRSEILARLTGPATAFEFTTTRLSVERTEHGAVVTNRLEGNFPGGQVDLRHTFVLGESDLIQQLTISA